LERVISQDIFTELLQSKERDLKYTIHSVQQARKRGLIRDHEDSIPKFEKDIKENTPHKVTEQDSENAGERKFKAYYPAGEGGAI